MSILNNSELAARGNPMASLFGALARARGEFPDIPRNRVATIQMKNGGRYSYRYADLADVINATTPALSAYGLAVMQWPEGSELQTMITHESGQSKVFPWPIKALPKRDLSDTQSYQSAIQVAKRYAMCAALGISTEETIEGDEKAHKTILSGGREQQSDPFIEDDGIRAPHGAKVTASMSKEQKAKEAGRAIIAQFDDVKTEKGLNGVWSRNQRFIDVFQSDYDAIFQDVYDAFNSRLHAIETEAA